MREIVRNNLRVMNVDEVAAYAKQWVGVFEDLRDGGVEFPTVATEALQIILDRLHEEALWENARFLTEDIFNNVGRHCTVRGSNAGRVWEVMAAVRTDPGLFGRYLVFNLSSGIYRIVSHRDMSNLY